MLEARLSQSPADSPGFLDTYPPEVLDPDPEVAVDDVVLFTEVWLLASSKALQ